jgi:hypothetical protein
MSRPAIRCPEARTVRKKVVINAINTTYINLFFKMGTVSPILGSKAGVS